MVDFPVTAANTRMKFFIAKHNFAWKTSKIAEAEDKREKERKMKNEKELIKEIILFFFLVIIIIVMIYYLLPGDYIIANWIGCFCL